MSHADYLTLVAHLADGRPVDPALAAEIVAVPVTPLTPFVPTWPPSRPAVPPPPPPWSQSPMKLLDRLFDRRAATAADYDRLTEQAAADADIPADAAERVLDAAGKSAEQLAEDARRLARRRELAALARTRPAVEKRLNDARARVEQIAAKRAAVLLDLDRQAEEVGLAVRAAFGELRQIDGAELELRRTAPADRRRRVEAADAHAADRHQAADLARRRLDLQRGQLDDVKRNPAGHPADAADVLARRVERQAAEVAELDAATAAARADADRAAAELLHP